MPALRRLGRDGLGRHRIGGSRLGQRVGLGHRAGLVAGEQGLHQRDLLHAGLDGSHRPHQQHGGLMAFLQAFRQAVHQGAHAEVVDRHDQAAGGRGDAHAGAAHQAVEDAATGLDGRVHRRLPPAGAGKVGDDVGLGPVDADDTMAGGLQLAADRGADPRGRAGDDSGGHEMSP